MGRQCPTPLVSPFLQFPRCLSYAKIELLSIQKRGAFNRFHQHESIRLLPFRTDNREISDDVRYYLGRIHFLDGTEPPEEDRINALVSRISYWIQSSEWNNNAQPVVQVQSIHSTTLVHNTNFVGRASELNEIYRLLHSDNNKLFLCGTGGIGKS